MAINVRVNQKNQVVVRGSTTFVGAATDISQIQQLAQHAYEMANTALVELETKYDKSGGTITGSVDITQDLTVGNTIIVSSETIDAGTF